MELMKVLVCPACGNTNPLSSSRFKFKPPIHHEPALSQLRFGYIPSIEERASIATKLEEFRADLSVLDRELDRLNSAIKQLETQRSDIELEISYQSGLLSPIRQLPDELLGEIMLYCSRGRVDVCAPRSDVWQLEKVCKRWKDLAISTQEIWSSLDVFLGSLIPYKAGIPVSVVARLVGLCVERSKDHSLSIKFIEIGSPVHFEEVFKLLSRYSHRWRDISFSLSMLYKPPNLDHGLARLRSLGLSGVYKGSTPFISFQHAQQLSEIRLFSVTKPFRTLMLPWSQLTYFKAIYCEFRTGEFMEMLQRMPNLVEFVSKWNKGLIKNHANSIKPLHFRSLSNLEMEASPAEISTVLQPLTLPRLTELYIVTHQTPNATSSTSLHIAESVAAVIRRSTCSITTLSLSSVDSACVSRMLQETPNLLTLDLGYIQEVEMILHELSGSDFLVPLLETFSLTCKGNQGMFSVGPLAEIIRARSFRNNRRGLSPGHLRNLNLTVREGRGVTPFAELLEPLSRDTGVAIVIHSLAA
ncbi:hypothetical protein BDZ97DRAFT_1916772 [Flammula alnicola]|nr:hypothetical protein BDZ97DRAFT_1916772 [Flammula alnicola]